jgi:hypothetical protein
VNIVPIFDVPKKDFSIPEASIKTILLKHSGDNLIRLADMSPFLLSIHFGLCAREHKFVLDLAFEQVPDTQQA